MTSFRLELAGGPAFKHYERRAGALDALLPPARRVPASAQQRAASLWLGHAYNEHHSATIMAHVVQLLTQAQIPLDLCALACDFPAQELIHADLCGRLSLALSPTPTLRSEAKSLLTLRDDLTPRQRADEAVIRLLCIGEGMSFAWIKAAKQRATHPGAAAVLKRLLRDEALHARFGWLYLEWALADVTPRERTRLSTLAVSALADYRSLLTDQASDDALAQFGLLDWPAQATATRAAIDSITAQLSNMRL